MHSGSDQHISSTRRILDKIRNGLVLQVFRNQLSRLGIEITPFYLTRVGTNLQMAPPIKGGDEGYSCGFLTRDDLLHMDNDPRGYAVEKLMANMQKGRKCYGIKRDKRVAAFMWIDLEECNFKPLRFPLKQDEAYTFSAYTMEAFRGRNVAPQMAFHCYHELRLSGRSEIYSVTEYFNRSAMKYKQKLGSENLSLYVYISLFKRVNRLFLLRKYR